MSAQKSYRILINGVCLVVSRQLAHHIGAEYAAGNITALRVGYANGYEIIGPTDLSIGPCTYPDKEMPDGEREGS